MVNRITDNELSVLERKIEQYLKNFKTIIGPLQIMRSNVGLKLTKFHSLLHLPYYVREYRAPMNFFEGHLEEFLKHFVKNFIPEQLVNIADISMILHVALKKYNVWICGKMIMRFLTNFQMTFQMSFQMTFQMTFQIHISYS